MPRYQYRASIKVVALSFEFGRILPHSSAAGPGYPLQFLSPPQAGLRDFRFYPLRGSGNWKSAG
jgi:hypothetical protein